MFCEGYILFHERKTDTSIAPFRIYRTVCLKRSTVWKVFKREDARKCLALKGRNQKGKWQLRTPSGPTILNTNIFRSSSPLLGLLAKHHITSSCYSFPPPISTIQICFSRLLYFLKEICDQLHKISPPLRSMN